MISRATPRIELETDRLLVFGGPYSNLQALEALRDAARALGFGPAEILCTGDLVGYCADPEAVVETIAGWGIATIAGNCDVNVGMDADDCGCGYGEGSACAVLSTRWYPYACAGTSGSSKAFLRLLPERATVRIGGRTLHVCHGGVEDIATFRFPSTAAAVKLDEIERAGTDGIIAGHSGLPFTNRLGTKLWHNAGVIGLPANDGTSETWFSTLTLEGQKRLRVVHHRLPYAFAEAARRMRAAGLPEAYAGALETGLWPSEDVLPAPEQARRGVPIVPPETVW